MGSHYIKVGNLKVDKNLLDDYLELICPANGYYDPTKPIPYEPDPNIPEVKPVEGEIVLIVCDAMDASIALGATSVSNKKIKYSLYGKNDTLISTDEVNNNAVWFKELPASGGVELTNGFNAFIVKITGVETDLLTFGCKTYSGYGSGGWPIVEAHIKCPSLTSLKDAFKNQYMILFIKFYGKHNNLDSLQEIARYASALIKVNLGDEMDNLTNMQYSFGDSGLEEAIFPEKLDSLQNMIGTFSNTKLKNQGNLPMDLPALTTMSSTYSGCKFMTGTVYIPNAPNVNNLFYTFRFTNIKKCIALSGYAISQGANGPTFEGCNLLEEIDFSAGAWGQETTRWLYVGYILSSLPNLKVIKHPKKLINLKYVFDGGGNTHQLLSSSEVHTLVLPEEIIYLYDNSTPLSMNLYVGYLTESFYLPSLRSSGITFGGNGNRSKSLKSVEIDWEKSVGNFGFRYAEFPVEEINRIFTALPDITGGAARTIDFRNNPGYAACDKSIAEDKGWTVL